MKTLILMMLLIGLISSCNSNISIARNLCMNHTGVSFVSHGNYGYMKVTCNDGTLFEGDIKKLNEDQRDEKNNTCNTTDK